jgi:callose synthase
VIYGCDFVFYLDEWTNFLERMGREDTRDLELSDSLDLRFWASYRGQTLARTG